MRETILRLSENGKKQYESSRFPYMKVVHYRKDFPNMEIV